MASQRGGGAAAFSGRTAIDELEDAVAHTDIAHRAKVLRGVTDLFATNSATLTGERLALFEDVMLRLLEKVNQSARADFGEQIARLDTAPPGIVRALALDGSIEVAGPILSRSDQVAEDTLIDSAKKNGQDHLLAISRRASLSEGITDVLVDRGNAQVALNIAQNTAAKFSEFGYSTLVKRAENEPDLAVSVWKRPEVPDRFMMELFSAASELEREELQRQDSAKAQDVREMIGRARDQLQATARNGSPEYRATRSMVQSLHDAGELNELKLAEFATAGKHDETAMALSLLCGVPLKLVERAMADKEHDQLLILVKSIGLSWDTVKAILSIEPQGAAKPKPDLGEAWIGYNKLQAETALKAMQYFRLRERAQDGA